MKKSSQLISSLLLVLSLFMINCKSNESSKIKETPKTFTLNADLENLEAEYLIYEEKDDTQPNGYRRDTLWIKDGKFTFKDSVSDYKLYFMEIPEAVRRFKVKYGDKEYDASVKAFVCRMWFIAYPGAEITYIGKVEDFMVNAYPSDKDGINDDLGQYHSQIFPLWNTMDAIQADTNTKEFTKEERQKLNDSSDNLYKKIKDLRYNFIKSHPKSIAASYVFSDAYYRKYYTAEDAEALFKNFDSLKLAGTPFYDEVKQRMEAFEKTGIGKQAPELVTTNTMDGSEFKLSSLRGNYVLIDYWGTWCGPCMGEMPKIKELHDKYIDKNFVVLGVNSGDTIDRWKKAIDKHGLSWTHIQTTKDNNLLIPFNVRDFPTKVFIDPNGKIIYSSNNPENVDMYQMIDRIFSDK